MQDWTDTSSERKGKQERCLQSFWLSESMSMGVIKPESAHSLLLIEIWGSGCQTTDDSQPMNQPFKKHKRKKKTHHHLKQLPDHSPVTLVYTHHKLNRVQETHEIIKEGSLKSRQQVTKTELTGPVQLKWVIFHCWTYNSVLPSHSPGEQTSAPKPSTAQKNGQPGLLKLNDNSNHQTTLCTPVIHGFS